MGIITVDNDMLGVTFSVYYICVLHCPGASAKTSPRQSRSLHRINLLPSLARGL